MILEKEKSTEVLLLDGILSRQYNMPLQKNCKWFFDKMIVFAYDIKTIKLYQQI